MDTPSPSWLLRYGLAVVALIVAFVFSLLLQPFIQRASFIFFFGALTLSASYGGFGPGLLTTILAIFLADYFLMPPRNAFSFDIPDLIVLMMFAVVALFVNFIQVRRKRTERDLRQQRERLRVTLSSIGDAVITTDTEGQITYLNSVAEDLTGWSQAEAYGKNAQDVFRIVNEQSHQSVESPVHKVLREGMVVDLANHSVLISKDGVERPIDDSGAPIRDDRGHILGTVLVFRDVSSVRQAQQTQEQLAAIVESSVDAIIGNDLNAVIRSWNKGAERMYGYGADECIGQPISILLPPDQANEILGLLERVKRGERIEHYETKQKRKDGVVLDVLLSVSPIRDADGNVVGASKIAHDITQRKKQEAELIRLFHGEQQARTETEEANQRLRFLSNAGQLLASSLDYDVTLNNLKDLILPDLADIFTADVIQPNQVLTRVAMAATNAETEAFVIEQHRRFPPDLQGILASPAFVAGEPFFFEHITPVTYEAIVTDPDHLSLLRKIDATSEILMPLRVREIPIGILTVVRQGAHPAYTQNDVTLIEELARRVAQAIDNARLYREVHEQRERLQVTLASIGDAVIATDQHGAITFMNPVAEGLTGWQQADAVKKPLPDVFNIVNEITRQRVESPVDEVLRAGTIVGLANHTTLIARDGREIPIDDSGAPIRTHDGAIAGVILVFRDITERRRAEKGQHFLVEANTALAASLDYEATVSSLARLAVSFLADWCVVDMLEPDGVFHRLGAAAADPAKEELVRALQQRYPILKPEAKHTLLKVFRANQSWFDPDVSPERLAAEARDAEHLKIEQGLGFKSEMVLSLTARQRMLGTITLVSARRSYTQADLVLAEDLAYRAALAIDNARLFAAEAQARRESEKANDLKLQFLAMISHELRTPLASIKGFATTLLASDVQWDPESQRSFIDIISEEADKLTELVEQLLDLSRLQAGTLRIKAEPKYVKEIIDPYLSQLQSITKQHRLVIAVPQGLPPVLADPHRAGQVIVNLVQNSAKYSPEGTSITIAAQDQGSMIQVDVRDEGPGISDEARPKLFQPFQQLEAAEDQRSKGVGLGLAICKGLIEAHGGRIWVSESPKSGTTMSFTLPITGPHPQ